MTPLYNFDNKNNIYAVLFFSEIAAVRHPGFIGRVLGPPEMTNWWFLTAEDEIDCR